MASRVRAAGDCDTAPRGRSPALRGPADAARAPRLLASSPPRRGDARVDRHRRGECRPDDRGGGVDPSHHRLPFRIGPPFAPPEKTAARQPPPAGVAAATRAANDGAIREAAQGRRGGRPASCEAHLQGRDRCLQRKGSKEEERDSAPDRARHLARAYRKRADRRRMELAIPAGRPPFVLGEEQRGPVAGGNDHGNRRRRGRRRFRAPRRAGGRR